jgi:hypothetical protein
VRAIITMNFGGGSAVWSKQSSLVNRRQIDAGGRQKPGFQPGDCHDRHPVLQERRKADATDIKSVGHYRVQVREKHKL